MSLTKILKKYVDIKLFEREQYDFKQEFFKELFDPYEYHDYKTRTTLLINTLLEEENLPFVFFVRYEQDGDKRREYWLLKETMKN
jgi:hypothetical protein